MFDDTLHYEKRPNNHFNHSNGQKIPIPNNPHFSVFVGAVVGSLVPFVGALVGGFVGTLAGIGVGLADVLGPTTGAGTGAVGLKPGNPSSSTKMTR